MKIEGKINGLTQAEILKRKEKGQINIVNDKNTKTNWQIISENVFTLFNLFNFMFFMENKKGATHGS